jgi:hypothetical protein
MPGGGRLGTEGEVNTMYQWLGRAALVAVVGCSAAGDPAAEDGAAEDGAGPAGSGGASAGSGGEGPIATGAGGGGDVEECPNVDVLFVVDNSASMADNQASLIASFPGFIAGIQERLAGAKSYHVGVVSSDAYYANAAGCTDIGDLVTQTGGIESSNAACGPFASGSSYLDESEPDLGSKFACIAQVGSAGSDDERVFRALLDATDPANSAPGACNAGFSRLDSLLVVVIITDEDDVADGCDGQTCMTYGSGLTPEEAAAQLVAHKAGLAENVVVLSLLGQKLDNSCGAQPASKLMGFTHEFGDSGLLGDVCSASYSDFFLEALPVVDEACAGYIPPPK